MRPHHSASTLIGDTLPHVRSEPDANLRLRRVQPLYLYSDDVERWNRLSVHSLEPNPYLSPQFVLPLLTHLPPKLPVQMQIVEDTTSGEWRAAGVFEITSPSMRQPLAYAQGLSSSYAFLDGFLVDRRDASQAIQTMLHHQMNHRHWHGFQFSAIRSNSLMERLLQSTAERLGMTVLIHQRWARAQFLTHQAQTVDEILERCSKSRRKSLRRGRRLLAKQGNVTYRLCRPTSGDDDCVDGFLRLEAMGWKGSEGTAIACDPQRETFFRCMVDGFARHQHIIMGELRLNDRLIASTCNVGTGDMLSAFKIGWDPEFSDAGVGLWSEIELAAAVSHTVPEIQHIDSSAKAGSHLESVWLDRQPMHSMTYSWSRRGRTLQAVRQYFRCLKRLMPEPGQFDGE